MGEINCRGRKFEVDDSSYLLDPGSWGREFTESLAEKEGIKLNEEHWKIIEEMRKYYKEFKSTPWLSVMCDKVGLKHRHACVYELFKHDGWPAIRMAGLPYPTLG